MKPATCPCGSADAYTGCCQPLHAGEALATSPTALMRSRYSAYVLELETYLLHSWHPATRPEALDLAMQQAAPAWLGLDLRAECLQDADHATVEFIARYRVGGGRAQRLHEISRFVRDGGRWFYLDGEFPPGS
jgi:SEC-C motif-containing protein